MTALSADGGPALDGFSEPTRAWFAAAFAAPTPAQAEAWAAIGRGENTLVIAPTGSGKTLAAFLWAIDKLATEPVPADPRERCRVLYISPLKALAVDIERNLRSPLTGVGHAARRLGQAGPDIRVGVRTGDTAADERRRLSGQPPDILITTPESLFLMLTSQAREALRSVQTVIVDEVHALAGGKRGAHLALSLERLDRLRQAGTPDVDPARPGPAVDPAADSANPDPAADPAEPGHPRRPAVDSANPGPAADPAEPGQPRRPAEGWPGRDGRPEAGPSGRDAGGAGGVAPPGQAQRIGLSATVRPAGEVASFLGGSRPVTIVAPPSDKRVELQIVVPVEDMADLEITEGAPGGGQDPGDPARRRSIWPHVEERVLDEIEAHKSTIVFANSRRLAERLCARLNELAAERATAADEAQGRDGPGAAPAEVARAHHGSVSRQERTQIEEALKAGRLPAVVATSSLELGIDMARSTWSSRWSPRRQWPAGCSGPGGPAITWATSPAASSSPSTRATWCRRPWWRAGCATARSRNCACRATRSTCWLSRSWR